MAEHEVTGGNQLQSAWNQRTDSFRNRLPSLLKAVGSCSEFTPVLGPLTSNMASLQPAIVLLLLLTLACGLRQGSVMIETLNSEQAIDPSEGTLDEGGAEQQDGSAEGQRYLVFCGENAMAVVLPPGSLSEMQVFDSSGMYPVFGLPEACDYSLTRENGRVVLHIHFAGCPVTVEEGSYTLRFLYRNSAGQLEIVTVSCSNSSHAPSSKTRSSRHPVLSYPAVKISPPQAVQLYFPYGEPVSVPQPDPLPLATLTASPLDLLFFPEFDPLFPAPGVPLPAFQWEQPSPTPTSMHVPAMPSSLGRRSKCKQRGDRLSSPRLDPLSSPEFGPLSPTPVEPLSSPEFGPLFPTPGDRLSSPRLDPLSSPEFGPLFPTPGDRLSSPQWMPLSPTPVEPLSSPEFDPLLPTPGVQPPTSQWEQLSPTPTSMQVTAMPSSLALHSNFKKGCSFPSGQRLPCGRPGTTAAECLRRGCCRDEATFACYYPMDVCLADRQFIFVVPSNVAGLPINPARLMVVGRSSCKPVIANRDFAVFKFGVTECGTHSYQIGETTVYLAEVQSPIRKRVLQYGIITRDIPVRLMVECRYSKGSLDLADSPVLADPLAPQASQSRLMKGWASAGYMVKSASLPALVRAKGLYGVQLRIAQDETFTKFCSEDHQPLKVLLGKPVYLELRINAPNPKATLVVHYCVAYPRSAKSALVLLYEGCPNPLDSDNISILYVAGQSQDPHVRRFEVKAFQFMDKSTNKYLNEEIYFMCSTEVCMPSQTPCKETCFDGKSSSTTAADVLNSYSQLKVKHF
ncbi:zona pellucida sperm-binding protein 1-like [Pygocentrus nattereri]|uniref:zona pellucida sperm-binding protein 1-like n=1 Tax=Pygocentrus nattereri TaxID=42514 RepID=UPI001891BD2D|nr:zona pellucida sperm-binding protein 1-like [Pygocentrus nattereri]